MSAAHGAAIALSRPGLLVRALAAVLAALLGLLLLVVAPLALLAGRGSPVGGRVPAGIPSAFVPLYRESARVSGVSWIVLAAVHKQETGFSTHPSTHRGLNPYGCCAGPFQFNVRNGPPSTWDAYKGAYRRGRRPPRYPHPARPHPSVYDDFDAAMAAGALLRANAADAGLGARTWDAVRRYNGAGPAAVAYADAVMGQARAWQASTPGAGGGDGPLPPTGRGLLAWPVRGQLVSPFGMRWGRLHAGIDLAVSAGMPIRAAATGRVTTKSWVGGYGRYTCLEHRASYSTCYAHQSRFGRTPPGGIVGRGQLVGYAGCTGHCFGAHLHFELRIDGRPVDPLPYLDGRR